MTEVNKWHSHLIAIDRQEIDAKANRGEKKRKAMIGANCR
jgi:hypothetical protein